jgi:hypothetical protein
MLQHNFCRAVLYLDKHSTPRYLVSDRVIMKNTLLAILLLLTALIAFPANATALSVHDDDEEKINAALGIQGWFSTASAKWKISIPYQTGTLESELNFNNIDSPIILFFGGGKLSDAFSFDLVYGTGSIAGGQAIDTDRVIPGGGTGSVLSESTSDITGDVRMLGGNLYFNNGRFAYPKGGRWGVLVGFLHYEDNLTIRNGTQTVPPLGPFGGLDSTYDFSWNAVRVGITRQAALTKSFSYSGVLSLYPYAVYRGEGYWNLRTTGPNAFRAQSPNFVQESSNGYGYDAALELVYALSEHVELSAGYRYFYLYARNGTDTTYFADGTAYVDRLDWVTVTRQGAYAQALFKF